MLCTLFHEFFTTSFIIKHCYLSLIVLFCLKGSIYCYKAGRLKDMAGRSDLRTRNKSKNEVRVRSPNKGLWSLAASQSGNFTSI